MNRHILSIAIAITAQLSLQAAEVSPSAPEPKVVCPLCKPDVPSLASVTETPWLEPSARQKVLTQPFHMTDQDGKKFDFAELAGKPIALTFLYTRCENPNKCLLTASTTAKLQNELRAAGMEGKVRLLVVTYDPEHDSSEVLRQYAAAKQIQCDDTTRLLRPEPSEKNALFKALNVAVNYDTDRVNIHGLQMILLDRQGRFVRTYRTLIWNNAAVLNDLRKLIAEQSQ